jgi:hypothetical protein
MKITYTFEIFNNFFWWVFSFKVVQSPEVERKREAEKKEWFSIFWLVFIGNRRSERVFDFLNGVPMGTKSNQLEFTTITRLPMTTTSWYTQKKEIYDYQNKIENTNGYWLLFLMVNRLSRWRRRLEQSLNISASSSHHSRDSVLLKFPDDEKKSST